MLDALRQISSAAPAAARRSALALLPEARAAVRREGEALCAARPDLADLVRTRMEEPAMLPLPREVPLWGGASLEAALALWCEQLDRNAAAAVALAADERAGWNEWMMAWVEGAADRATFFRAEVLVSCLREIAAYGSLIANPPAVRRLAAGQGRSDDLLDTRAWEFHGPGTIARDKNGLHLEGAGLAGWLHGEVGSHVVSVGYRPERLDGAGAGALFAVPAQPRSAAGWAAAAGEMVDYNYGFDTWHCSLCRSQSGVSNLRRTGRGLRMCSTVAPDPCATPGRDYRVELALVPGWIQVLVDGRLIHLYPDTGSHGPALRPGRFGVRLFVRAVMRLTLTRLTVERCT